MRERGNWEGGNNIKRILGLFLVLGIVFEVAACSNHTIPKEFLSPHKGEYSVLVIYPNGNGMGRPKFVDDLRNHKASAILSKYSGMHLKEAQKSYPFLNIKKAPAYIVINTKKIVFKTNDVNKVSVFLEQRYKEKK